MGLPHTDPVNDVDTNTREERMPAKKVMAEFRKRKLHSGSKHGPIVRKKSQAKAILLSELRKEGRIPERGKSRRKRSYKR